ncbi:catechol 2,3-dioxygenase-like lactoylglutathione lyase family enzyme [Streptomyces sp. SAI-208]|nr:catechol 2,3-dioxygenase-like lactoylglutathione lyase family enzyme [Streptomyces sp. SAI-090]MDH6572030.1 catechol 2,3-dioxygenase-like lactoylglutathione lyase family enzyme [Streptomyces sp. SAI-117]MDH6583012.1 catechol 2,3-dioxygenase-like lactoylglutathione lyase family enzyme [Streptomyces sp. SAI-133]MDH6611712.1 catechol 2,3-dioxygenase-like lactoylglutathione lyase family enzyme [Streptomyces sp. SAI-208]MDH6615182.1 catechol 2,3-dioxygenase-like lactoylglutathione lyase family en
MASVTAMDIRIRASFLPHDDPAASLAFYRDVLGFEVRADVGRGGMRWITVAPAGRAGPSVVLRPPGDDPELLLATPRLDSVFERLQARAEVIQEPIEQPYGMRDCAFLDPAGNMIRVQELR